MVVRGASVTDSADEMAGAIPPRAADDEAAFADLIRRAQRHDQAAFAELYRLTVRPVYRYLSARVQPRDLVEELTEEVFVAAFQGMGSLRAGDERGLLAWLFQIARHKLADHLRQRYRSRSVTLDAVGELEDPQRPPDEVVSAAEEEAAVRRALDDLTPEQREVIVYKYVLGYDNQRTGQLLGKNANAVNQLHHRALASLHRLLSKERGAYGRA
jgi:RNA polymerase sigma-70 factor, ECF subfamily